MSLLQSLNPGSEILPEPLINYATPDTGKTSGSAWPLDGGSMIKAPPIANPDPRSEQSFENTVAQCLGSVSDLKTKAALVAALSELSGPTATVKAVARRHSLDPAVLSSWWRKLGFPNRKRGKRALTVPTSKHLRIIKIVGEHGVSEAVRRTDLSKQRIYQIIQKWKPDLIGRRSPAIKIPPPPKTPRVSRDIVISFRITRDEWQHLLNAPGHVGMCKLTGRQKARAILLDYLSDQSAN